MHKFYLGQTVVHRARYAPSGVGVITAKLPERDGEYEYRVRNLAEAHERIARESDLEGMSVNEVLPGKRKL